ncbi:MAG: TIR domain-containing protein [Taibaiella sp.]|nr:TIR domain-containing protein [Taibaiella sp.]
MKSIFVSYSHKDNIYLERLKVHLIPLERMGHVKLWSDTIILSGEKRKEKIEEELNNAAIAVLLISADFMASDFIISDELQPLLKLAESKGTIIIPIIIKPCRFLREPTLSQFQSVNNPLNPLCKISEFEQEEIYEKVAQRIELAIKSE